MARNGKTGCNVFSLLFHPCESLVPSPLLLIRVPFASSRLCGYPRPPSLTSAFIRGHSCRSASIGFIRAAIIAGYSPNPIPISPLTMKLPTTDHVAICVG